MTTHSTPEPRADEAGRRAVAARRGGLGTARRLFLLAAGISFAASVALFFTGDHERGIFVGIWVPSILAAGILLLGRDGHD